MDKSKLPILERGDYIKTFLKLIDRDLQKGLPETANEWEMTEKAYKIFHKGLRHLRKRERMAYES